MDNSWSIGNIIKDLLVLIDENPTREGLKETPLRAQKAWEFWTSGRHQHPAEVLKTFEDGADSYDEMIVVRNIPFYSHCEHHLAPFFGTVDIAYLPEGKIVGLSKLPRLVNVFSRRLQVQERMTTQIAEAIMEHLEPKGVGVVVRARHLCMESRGIQQQGSETETSALRGVFTDPEPRNEFLQLIRG